MKFTQVNIYGFGKWVDQAIDFSDNTPLCFYGENESGKSTLQQFILYVLFGLPPRKLAHFKPVSSNKIGGRLTVLEGHIGQYQIERIGQEVICYLPKDEIQDEAWLNERLQGINRDVFTSIYAFSAMDLIEIRQMKKTQLSDVLLSVGLSGSTNIYEAEKVLETKMGQLFKKQGKNPLINKQINVVQEGNDTLIKRQKDEIAYQDKQMEITRLSLEQEKVTELEEQCKSSLLKTEKLFQLLPQLQEYQHLKEQMRSEETVKAFPENGVERLEYWQEKLHPLQGELRVVKMQLQKDELAAEKIEAALYDQTIIESATAIMQQKSSYEYLLQQEKALSIKVSHIQDNVVNKLATVEIEEKIFQQFHFPFHLEKYWQELQQKHEQLLQKEELQTAHYNELQVKETEIEKARIDYDNEQITETEIEQVQNAYRQTGAISQPNEQKEKWQQWEKRRMKTAKVIFITAAIIAVLMLLFASFNDNAVLFVLPVVILLAGVLQYINMKNTIAFILQESMSNDNQSPNTNDETYTQLLMEQQRIEMKTQQLEEQAQQLVIEKKQWKEAQAIFLKEENKWIQQVERERKAYPFIQHIEIDYWLDLLSVVRKVQQLQRDKGQQEKELFQIRAELETIEQEKEYVSQQFSEEEGSLLTFEQIQEIIEKQSSEQYFLDQYHKQIIDRTETIQSLQEKITIYGEEMKKLFNYANVRDEETFLKLAATLSRQQSIQEEMSRLEQSLASLLSTKEFNTLLQQPLIESELTYRLQSLEGELTQMQQQQSELNKTIATIQMEIKHLEFSEEHSTAIHQQQIEQDKLQQMAQRWASLKIAQSTINAAKTAYQKNHLDKVLQQTSDFFRTITDGAYHKVIAPTENGIFQVEGKHQIRYTIDKLSQGTIDQLYVSLRLAIGMTMSKVHNMPFMMDDAFVHFDHIRLEKMIQILKSIPTEQQIIIYTCRTDIAKAFDHVYTLSS